MPRARFRLGSGVLPLALFASLVPLLGAVSASASPVVPVDSNVVGCDPIDPAACLLPFPNDYFRADGRLRLRDSMMPRNRDGRPIRARDYNLSDGFSPGQTIVTRVPGLDTRGRSLAPEPCRSPTRRVPSTAASRWSS